LLRHALGREWTTRVDGTRKGSSAHEPVRKPHARACHGRADLLQLQIELAKLGLKSERSKTLQEAMRLARSIVAFLKVALVLSVACAAGLDLTAVIDHVAAMLT
jgi:hypothetical protein